MTDGIISGAGTSRNFKVPANAKALYPTWDAALDAMIAGTFTFDLYGINPAGWDVVGDKLGKETLLTDALCTALGLPTTATPTQAMDKLRQLVATAQSGVDNGVKIATGSYAGTGGDSKSLSFPFIPKFVMVYTKNGIVQSTPGAGSVAYSDSFIWAHNQVNTALYIKTVTFTLNGTLFSWSGTQYYIANNSGTEYYYFAIG